MNTNILFHSLITYFFSQSYYWIQTLINIFNTYTYKTIKMSKAKRNHSGTYRQSSFSPESEQKSYMSRKNSVGKDHLPKIIIKSSVNNVEKLIFGFNLTYQALNEINNQDFVRSFLLDHLAQKKKVDNKQQQKHQFRMDESFLHQTCKNQYSYGNNVDKTKLKVVTSQIQNAQQKSKQYDPQLDKMQEQNIKLKQQIILRIQQLDYASSQIKRITNNAIFWQNNAKFWQKQFLKTKNMEIYFKKLYEFQEDKNIQLKAKINLSKIKNSIKKTKQIKKQNQNNILENISHQPSPQVNRSQSNNQIQKTINRDQR